MNHYFALQEQNIRGPVPDVLALHLAADDDSGPSGGGLAMANAPPKARAVRRSEANLYAERADRVSVRHRHGDVVAVIEIVSPGNKGSRAELKAFVSKSVELLRQHVHLMVIDLFPPTPRDPQGIHRAIWEEFGEEDSDLPRDKPLVVASYDAGPPQVAYVESMAVGDALPGLPLFLRPEIYVPAPLEASYQAAWDVFPAAMKKLLQ